MSRGSTWAWAILNFKISNFQIFSGSQLLSDFQTFFLGFWAVSISTFIAENCNDFFLTSSSSSACEFRVSRAGSQLKIKIFFSSYLDWEWSPYTGETLFRKMCVCNNRLGHGAWISSSDTILRLRHVLFTLRFLRLWFSFLPEWDPMIL